MMKNDAYKTDELISRDIDAYLETHQNKTLLRFITCGSVDDGKSTLIGRLLYDSKMIFEDQLDQLKADSKKDGTQGEGVDFALLLDGLAAEREQGITIDVAYRFFTTKKRKFIVADTPGHQQYTRNMITGASTADLAIILIDASKGVLTQTRRHSYLVQLIGIKNIVIAINKMDLINYNEEIYNQILEDYAIFAKSIGIKDFVVMPISGTKGDNITKISENTPWYKGTTLLKHLELVDLDQTNQCKDFFSMPVQLVNRPNLNFRGFSGRISSGSISPGDEVCILPSNKITTISQIVTFDGNRNKAVAGQSVTLTFNDEVDCSRGQIITSSQNRLEMADQFEVTLIWMGEDDLIPGRSYFLKIGTQTVSVVINQPKYKINVNTMEQIATKALDLNAIGIASITTDREIPFASYKQSRDLGGFIIIDKITNATVGAGLINFALRRAQNIHWQFSDIDRTQRADQKNQKPVVLWMTGLSGSGKSTIANALEKKLIHMNRHTFVLDGDNLRHGLNKDLGFTDTDRIENMRRVGEVAKLMTDAGLIVIAAFISPFILERQMVRQMMLSNEFLEIHIDTPLEVVEQRDVKGLYAKARSGDLKNFTGIDSPYEAPEHPEIYIDTTKVSADKAVELIINKLLG